jgi:ATP-dependent helicase/nuclease subunit A
VTRERPPADLAARKRIENDTSATLFVEAGAGSGKTKSLVDRVRTLVLRDGVPMTDIAAVTFTEKAGAELRDRLRAEFEDAWRSRTPDLATRAEQALVDLDSAAIGTLHSFAQRILSMHPIEVGLPPLIEVLDEVGSSVAFDERWSVLQRELLDDADLAPAVLRALDAGVTLRDLRSLMKAFGSDWDLVEDRVVVDTTTLPVPDLDGLAVEATLLALRSGECRDRNDKFLTDLTAFGDWAAAVRGATDEAERFALIRDGRQLKSRWGRAANWPDLAGLKGDCKDLVDRVGQAHSRLMDAVIRPLARWISQRVVESAERRAAEGRLEFHDLLVLARRLLRTDPEARASLRDQFPGHRSHSDRTGHAVGRRPGRRRARLAGHPDPAGFAVRGGRPEAVDLPVPAGRHSNVPGCPGQGRRVDSAGYQLPDHRTDRGLDQPGVLCAHAGGGGDATGLPGTCRTPLRGGRGTSGHRARYRTA